MEHPDRGGWASEFQDDLPGEGRPAELPGGGMPGPSGDEDGNAGALPAPAFTRHHSYYGGWKPPPPTVRPMRHASPLTGPERQAPGHGTVCQGGRAEETTARGGGGLGGWRKHDGPQAGPERTLPGHGTVCKVGGADLLVANLLT